jgi:hypothetical protein
MRTRILTILGVLLVAVSTNQMGTAAARGVRKVTRAPHPINQQLRNASGSVGSSSIAQSNHSERYGSAAAVLGRSCDIFWCYGT